MRYYLDTNIWIVVFEYYRIYEGLLISSKAGKIEVAIHQENILELIENPKIGRAMARRNRALLAPFLDNIQADGIFVISHSRLGTARLPNRVANEVFDRHLQRMTNKNGALADGIHSVNAAGGQLAMVSCDQQVRTTAKNEKRPYLCLLDFLDQFDWAPQDLSSCKSCRTLRE